MCAEPHGSNLPIVGECPKCGADVDKDGDAIDICAYGKNEPCPLCGSNPCDQSC